MKLKIVLLLIIVSSCNDHSKKTDKELNVLFIGNSLTFYHDMPQMVQAMLTEANTNIKIHQITFPGMFLGHHLDKTIMSQDEQSVSLRDKIEGEVTPTETKVLEKPWDIIVLQEGTIRVLIPECRDLEVDKAIKKYKALATNPECRFILFNTWASKSEYPKNICYPGVLIDTSLVPNQKYCAPKIENLKQHTQLINESYSLLAKNNAIEKSNNGDLFFEVRKKHKDINLFDDTFHPSVYGSFLNACEFYQILTQKKAMDLEYHGIVEPEKATILKNIALISFN